MRASLLVTAFVPFALSAQTTFAPIGAAWSYLQHYMDGSTVLFTVHCVGDTLIGEDTCSVLDYADGVSQCMGFSPIVRTSGDTVYWQDPMDNAFQVLYVVGLPVGERWRTAIGRGWDIGGGAVMHDTLEFRVTASDVVVVDGQALRRSTVEAEQISSEAQYVPFSGTVTERLGHSAYMFPWIDGACDIEANNPLRCYTDPDIDWLLASVDSCDQGGGIRERMKASTLDIRPSLAAAGEAIRVQVEDASAADVDVIDAAGRSIFRGHLVGGRAVLRIDRPGIHTVVVRDGGSRSVGRIAVHD